MTSDWIRASARNVLLGALVALCLIACSHTSSLQSAEKVDDYLDEMLANLRSPGLRVKVVREGKVVLNEARGIRLVGDKTPLSTEDRFHLGSCTKAMTAYLVARLIDAKHLTWDTTLSELFPQADIVSAYKEVTVHDLIRHEGGMPGYLGRANRKLWNALWDGRDDDPVDTRAMLTQEILRVEPPEERGTYLYSNSGYVVLASALEARLEKSWERLVEEYVFAPLKMENCGIGAPAQFEVRPPLQPWGHRMLTNGELKPMKPGPVADLPPAIAPAGGVHCSFDSWMRFINVFLNRDQPSSTLSIAGREALLSSSEGGRYSGGWRRVYREWGDGLVLFHAGSNKRFYSVAWLAPDKRSVVLVSTNLYYSGIESTIDRLVGDLISVYIQDHYAAR